MELIYSVQKPNIGFALNHMKGTMCRISSRNIIAFVSPYNIIEPQSGHGERRKSESNVYACDIVSPWNVFKITTKNATITNLEWDTNGDRLLICDSTGCVEFWVEKNKLASDWFLAFVSRFDGEYILKTEFFQNTRTLNLIPEKKEHVLYMEKFQRSRTMASLPRFGGTGEEGLFVVTATGLIGAFFIPAELEGINSGDKKPSQYPINIVPVTSSLGSIRYYLTSADITYVKSHDGSSGFRVAVSNAIDKVNVQCFQVQMCRDNEKLILNTQSLPSFFLHEDEISADVSTRRVTHLCWMSCSDIETLITVEVTATGGSVISLWGLNSKMTPIHKLLQSNKTEVFQNFAWTKLSTLEYTSEIRDICISKQFADQRYIFLVMSDNKILMLRKDLKLVSTTNLQNDCKQDWKQRKTDKQLIAADISFMSHILLVMDNMSTLHAFKVPHHYEQLSNQVSLVSYKTTLLEYCIVSGYDASDILMTLKQTYLETLIEKLTDNFTRQPSSVQQHYYVKFLTMKMNLYRLLLSGQSKAHDLNCLVMLHSILTAFKSFLRPSDLSSHDKGPAENLAMVLSESVPDVDKVLFNLDPKDFTVEPSTLPSLQQLIQWVADLALNILARLPQNSFQGNQSKIVGYDISKDIVALNSIRELLVMIRIWGLLNINCLPTFSKSVENLDILAMLFRMLTRLALNPADPDEMLLDECCLLPTQTLVPDLQFCQSVTCINSPALFLNSFPLQIVYNIEPEILNGVRLNYPDNCPNNDLVVDSVRNLVMGKNPSAVRHCYRCGTFTSTKIIAKTAAINAWEQRWANYCRCGGYWALQKF